MGEVAPAGKEASPPQALRTGAVVLAGKEAAPAQEPHRMGIPHGWLAGFLLDPALRQLQKDTPLSEFKNSLPRTQGLKAGKIVVFL